jgi:hypothetical protein
LTGSAALWLTIVGLGVYHGLNPAMGWPIAVANGLEQRRTLAVLATLLPLGGGHLAAMAVALAPFAWLSWYADWNRAIRLSAGVLVLLFGVYKLVQRRHPRALARIRPTQLAWWSFLMATAHGAGLMLVPFMLGLCTTGSGGADASPGGTLDAAGHAGLMDYLARSNLAMAALVASVHTLVMILSGLGIAWMVYRYLGLAFLRRAWLNLDIAWGASLVVAGAAGIIAAL